MFAVRRTPWGTRRERREAGRTDPPDALVVLTPEELAGVSGGLSRSATGERAPDAAPPPVPKEQP